jgi:hypothetical protein
LVTDAQVRKLMDEMSKQVTVEVGALRSGMHRNTARRYLSAGKLPSELKEPRDWRTRPDPFSADWLEVLALTAIRRKIDQIVEFAM